MLDPALAPYVAARDDAAADGVLTTLLDERLAPLVRTIAARKLRDRAAADGGTDAVDDAVAAALLRLVERLAALRAGVEAAPIADLDGYAATVAFNVCAERIRARYPERTRLRHRLRYVCEHHPGLASWRDREGDRVCGLAAWAPSTPAVEAGAVRDLVHRHDAVLHLAPDEAPASLATTVRAVVERLGGPIEIDRLCAALAEANRLDRRPPAGDVGTLPELRPGADLVVERRDALRHAWAIVRTLPPRQRAALLLHVRNSDGAPILWVLPVSGVATLREIAGVLDLEPIELAALWKTLPLGDQAIAERLGCTRQQVINLRVSARRRLLRGRAAGPSDLDGVSPSQGGRT
jgi:hypothetical protein